FLDDEVETDERGARQTRIRRNHLFKFGVIERRRFLEVTGDTQGRGGGMHLGVKLYWCGNDNQIELPMAALQHHPVVFKNANSPGAESPEFLLHDEVRRLGIAGADEPGFAPFFQPQESAVMR